MITAIAICRACGGEQPVKYGSDYTSSAGFFSPDHCLSCGSDDLVPLANLSKRDLDEIDEMLAQAEGRPKETVQLLRRQVAQERARVEEKPSEFWLWVRTLAAGLVCGVAIGAAVFVIWPEVTRWV